MIEDGIEIHPDLSHARESVHLDLLTGIADGVDEKYTTSAELCFLREPSPGVIFNGTVYRDEPPDNRYEMASEAFCHHSEELRRPLLNS